MPAEPITARHLGPCGSGAPLTMPDAFNFHESPFDRLSPEEQALVRNKVRAGATRGAAFVRCSTT